MNEPYQCPDCKSVFDGFDEMHAHHKKAHPLPVLTEDDMEEDIKACIEVGFEKEQGFITMMISVEHGRWGDISESEAIKRVEYLSKRFEIPRSTGVALYHMAKDGVLGKMERDRLAKELDL